ncbi:MAG: glycosyltransferase [archaeon]
MNEMFLSLIKKDKPEYIFLLLMYDEFYIETLRKIKEISPKTKIINFFTDDELRFHNYSRYFAPFIDHGITTYPPALKWAKSEHLANFHLIMYCCNIDIFKKINVQKKYDVSFIGQPTPERVSVIKYLIKKGIEVSIWGKKWDTIEGFSEISSNYRGYADDINRITNESKIILSFLLDDFNKGIQIKGRLTEVGGSGTFQIVTDNTLTKEMFVPGKDVAYFKNAEDLAKKISYYLKNEKEREDMAHNAYKKVISEFNWDTKFRKFFNSIKKTKPKQKWPENKSLILDVSSLQQSNLESLLKNMSEDSLTLVEGSVKFIPESEKMKKIAFKAGANVLLNDCLVSSKGLGEIFALKAHSSPDPKKISKAFPLSCFSFSKKFVKKNISLIKKIIEDRMVSPDSIDTVLAFPIINLPQKHTNSLNNTPNLISKKFEITLYSLLSNHKYLKLAGYSASLFSSLLLHGNLFILSSARENIQKFRRGI